MATIEQHSVFIASPGGLETERKAFRQIVDDFNRREARDSGHRFEVVGWEDSPSGAGRPQEIINRALRKCNFFVMLLWVRWGSPPDVAGKTEYESGTEEEFRVAEEALRSGELREIAIFFKGAPPIMMADAGPQLQKVLSFRSQIEREKRYLYKTFDKRPEFERLVRLHLSTWLGDLQTKRTPTATVVPAEAPAPRPGEEPSSAAEVASRSEHVTTANRLADEGRLTEAEVHFARAIARGDDRDAFIEFGYFLHRLGRNDQAIAMFERVLELSKTEDHWASKVENGLGHVARDSGNTEQAERHYRRALSIAQSIGDEERIAVATGNLGMIYVWSGRLPEAEEMLRSALGLNEQLKRTEGIARVLGNLGVVLLRRGDLVNAESVQRRAIALLDSKRNVEELANGWANLATIFIHKGDLPGALELLQKARGDYERLGSREGTWYVYRTLGFVLNRMGKAKEAKAILKKADELRANNPGVSKETPAA